ncbi:MAG: lipid A export permease/ATP-binding protein MsbA [Panacagrimonas sp.]
MSFEPLPDYRPLTVYKRLLRYSLPHWRVFLAATVGMVAIAATEVGYMSLMKPLLDGSFVERDPQVIRLMPWAILGLFVVRGFATFTATFGMSWIARHIVMRMRGQMFEHLLEMPTRFYDRMSSGQLIARLTYHVEQVADATTNVLTTLIKDGLTVIGLIGLMFWLNWKLAAFTLTAAPLISLVLRYVSRRFRSVQKRIQENVGVVTQAAEETISGQRVVKIHNAQAFERERFAVINERARSLAMKIVATKAGSDAVIQFIAAIAIAAIVFVATQPEMLAQITPGTFVAFMGAMLGLMNPIKSLANVNEKLQRGIAAATELFQLMSEQQEPRGGERALDRAEGRVEFRDVQFRYRAELGDALKGVSVSVQAGQTVAFVGRSGSGKSTLLALVPRFYDPDAGSVLLDGHDLREYPTERVRAQVALVDQQVRLFDSTVAGNIAYGLIPPPDEARIIEAAKAAHAWEFIEKLPQGLATPLGPNGASLSGGQRQRIAIARALLKDAPILILDEATSALDTESERLIQAALERLVQGRTTLVIAHRLSTIQSADCIVVMQDGQVIEQGRHEQLLALNGHYSALHRMQFEDAD